MRADVDGLHSRVLLQHCFATYHSAPTPKDSCPHDSNNNKGIKNADNGILSTLSDDGELGMCRTAVQKQLILDMCR